MSRFSAGTWWMAGRRARIPIMREETSGYPSGEIEGGRGKM